MFNFLKKIFVKEERKKDTFRKYVAKVNYLIESLNVLDNNYNEIKISKNIYYKELSKGIFYKNWIKNNSDIYIFKKHNKDNYFHSSSSFAYMSEPVYGNIIEIKLDSKNTIELFNAKTYLQKVLNGSFYDYWYYCFETYIYLNGKEVSLDDFYAVFPDKLDLINSQLKFLYKEGNENKLINENKEKELNQKVQDSYSDDIRKLAI